MRCLCPFPWLQCFQIFVNTQNIDCVGLTGCWIYLPKYFTHKFNLFKNQNPEILIGRSIIFQSSLFLIMLLALLMPTFLPMWKNAEICFILIASSLFSMSNWSLFYWLNFLYFLNTSSLLHSHTHWHISEPWHIHWYYCHPLLLLLLLESLSQFSIYSS